MRRLFYFAMQPIPKSCITNEIKEDDYLPINPQEVGRFEGNITNAGTYLANLVLPMPSLDRGVPTVFTHFDGVDALNKFDPSGKDAIDDDERTINYSGLITMRRASDVGRLVVVAAVVERRGFASIGRIGAQRGTKKNTADALDIVRFGIEKPELGFDTERGEMVVVSGASMITRGIHHLFPKTQ